MRMVHAAYFIVAVGGLVVAGCGLLTAPVSVPAAVAENASFTFNGSVVDSSGKPLEGVVVHFTKVHHFWTPVKGSTDVTTENIQRVDKTFNFEERGSYLELTFSKDNFYDVTCKLMAENANQVITRDGAWPNVKDFPVVMISSKVPEGLLAHFNAAISYADYPIANCVALPNLATDGRSGDIIYSGKDANDRTIFPAGTLYLTLDKEPPLAINAKGELDPKELDIPHHVTLHIAGAGGGFIRIEPRAGYQPMSTCDQAPAEGYGRELTFDRARLKVMRTSSPQDIVNAYEYFYFRAGNRYGKGIFSWGSSSGKPTFRYELYLQPVADNRELITHRING